MTTNERIEAEVKKLRASHKAMLEVLVQILEEVIYPVDKLMPEVESIITTAEQLEAARDAQHKRLVEAARAVHRAWGGDDLESEHPPLLSAALIVRLMRELKAALKAEEA